MNDQDNPYANSQAFSVAVLNLMSEHKLAPPQAVLAFGILAKAMVDSCSDPAAAFHELIHEFMHGMGVAMMDGEQAREVLAQVVEDAEGTPPRTLN